MNSSSIIHFYIITLQSERDRLEWVRTHIIPSIDNPNIYNAIDGRIMSDPEIKWWVDHNYLPENYRFNTVEGVPYRKGQIGCALSHIRVWELLQTTHIPTCILEDDCQIIDSHNFREQLDQIISQLPSDWDHCNIYHHPKFTTQITGQQQYNQSIVNSHNLKIMGSVPMWGTVGYLISSRGIKKLLRYTKPIFNTVDEMIKHLVTKGLIKSYTSVTSLVSTIGNIDSDQKQQHPHQLSSTIWGSGTI